MTGSARYRPWVIGGAVIVYLVLALVLASWAAGAIFFLLHKAAPHHVTPLTWPTYARFYWGNGRQRQLLVVSALVPGALALFVLGFLMSCLTEPERELHGSARFASRKEVDAAGLTGPAGIIVGKHEGRFLQFPGQQFVLLAAPTRSGKGVSFVIPNLLNWPDSAVVLDIKLENFQLTSKFRADHGQAVFLFNPYAEDGRTHRWNPLDGISRDPNLRVGDLLTLASALYPSNPGDKDAFWADTAKNLFLGIALMLMDDAKPSLTFGEILRQSSGQGRGLKDYLADRINARAQAGAPYSSDCLQALNRFLSTTDNTLANVIASFNAPLVPFANPLIDAATATSDFDIAKVRDQRMSVYIGIQPNRLADAALLLNLFFSQLINLNTKELPTANRHPFQCLLILDEFTAVGKIGVLAKANAYISGYGLRLLTIIQSVAQLEGVYGPHDARTLITNHAMQVLFTPREQKDANAYSEMLGTYTVKSTSKGLSTNRGFAGGGSRSENVSDQRRALLLPQELKDLPDDEQIIVLEHTRPIRCHKARFFREHVFVDRLKGVSATLNQARGMPKRDALDKAAFSDGELSVCVPQLKLEAHVARVEGRTRLLRPDEEIDMDRLDHDVGDLPTFERPDDPRAEEVDHFVSGYQMLAGVQIDPIDLSSELEDMVENTGLVEDNVLMEA